MEKRLDPYSPHIMLNDESKQGYKDPFGMARSMGTRVWTSPPVLATYAPVLLYHQEVLFPLPRWVTRAFTGLLSIRWWPGRSRPLVLEMGRFCLIITTIHDRNVPGSPGERPPHDN